MIRKYNWTHDGRIKKMVGVNKLNIKRLQSNSLWIKKNAKNITMPQLSLCNKIAQSLL